MVTALAQVVWWLVRAALVATARTVWIGFRRPGLSLPALALAALAVLGVRLGWLLPATVAVVVATLLGAWWRLHRPSFSRWVGLRVRQWWRRWFRYGALWPFWMGRCGLTLTDEKTRKTVRPALVKVRCTPSVDRLLLRLPAGFKPDDVRGKRDELAHAMKAIDARVRRDKPRHVWLDLEVRNPLAATIPAVPIPDRLSSAALDVDRLDGLVIGHTDDGSPWRLRVRGSHVFIAGATGSGKGSIIWSTVRALAPFIHAGLVQVWAIDPKGGMELEFGRDLFTRYERDDFAAMVALLKDAAGAMDERCRRLRGTTRKFTPTPSTPLVLVLVDELATLTALLPERKLLNEVESALGLLLTKGRAPGYCVVAAVQDVTKEVCRWRDLFPDRVALRLAKAIEVDMALGDGAYDAGAYCDAIPRSLPGIAYVLMEGHAEPVRVRAAYVTDDEIQQMARDYKPPRRLQSVDNDTEDGEAA